jgi:hypothetical protein
MSSDRRSLNRALGAAMGRDDYRAGFRANADSGKCQRTNHMDPRIPRFGKSLFAGGAVLLVCSLPYQAVRMAKFDTDRRDSLHDSPRGQSEWFLTGRRYPSVSRLSRAAGQQSSAAEKLREAFAEDNRTRDLSGFAQPTWREVGPRPQSGSNWGSVSGRVTSLALDPVDPTGNALYVGTAFGGLWRCARTLSDAPVCDPKSDYQVSLSIGSIAAVARNGSTTVYVGTGEPNNSADSYYGQGIIKSNDGGTTWEKAVYQDKDGHNFSGAAVSKILIDPTNVDMVFAAVTTAALADGRNVTVGIYVSTDAGKSWSLELPDGGVSDLVYDAVRKTYFAAVVGHGVYIRIASEHRWVQLTSPFQCTSAITDTNFARASLATRDGVLWVLISNNQGELSQPSEDDLGLVESDDGGVHWSPVQPPQGLFFGQGYYDQILAAPPHSSEVVIGGIDVWTTGHARGVGTAWTNLTNAYSSDAVHPDQHAIAFVDNLRWYVGNDGGVWSTNNAGGNWTNRNSSIGTIQFVSVSPDPSRADGYFGGSQDNDTAYSEAGGALNWRSTLDGDGGYTDVDDKHHYFAERNNVSLFYSDSLVGGWRPVVDGQTISERQAFYVPYSVLATSATQVVLGTFRMWLGPGTPECAGAGWRPVSDDLTRGESGYITAIGNFKNSPKVIAVTSDSAIQMTEDIFAPQPIWTNIGDKPLPIGRTFSSVLVDPFDKESIFVGVMGFGVGTGGSGAGHVFKRVRVDGNFQWLNVTGNLMDVPVNSIVVDPTRKNNIYVGTDTGVWRTTDGGKVGSVWRRYGNGLPHSAVLQLKVWGQPKPFLVAATHGRGAWEIPLTD